MLQSLVDFAQRRGLLGDTSMQDRVVWFVIVLNAQGAVQQVRAHVDEQAKARRMRAPTEPKGRTSGVLSSFLVDNAQYTLGQGKADEDPAKTLKNQARADRCKLAFETLVDLGLAVTQDDGLRAVSRYLKDLDTQRPAVLARLQMPKAPKKARASKKGSSEPSEPEPMPLEAYTLTGAEVFAFELDTDLGLPVHQRPAVATWWRTTRGAVPHDHTDDDEAQASGAARCLVTGERAELAELHPAIKRVPGAQPTGAFLVSFNGSAFESWGLKQGLNAPVSEEAATAYGIALNWMLDAAPERTRRFRQALSLGDDTVLVIWSRPPEGEVDGDDLAAGLMDCMAPEGFVREADPETYRKWVAGVFAGIAPREGDDATRFYAVSLGSNAARVVIRDHFECTAAEVKANLRAWFDGLRIGLPDLSHPSARPAGIEDLLHALRSRPSATQDKGEMQSALASKLVRAALYGEPLSAEILRMAVTRMRLAPRERADNERELRLRAGLIRQCLLRPSWTERREVTVALDEANQEVPYVLGRLFSVLESLQRRAQGGDLNSTLRDKFFASASSAPASVFGPLLQRAQHHISKIDGKSPDYALSKVMDLLPSAGFPAVLSLEHQGVFAIGYYHQREHDMRMAREHNQKSDKTTKTEGKTAEEEDHG
ncbi:MAG: type I-C CRISPR-associated protein Cas8c/Csd1 [Deltaproteobacteria bacterium]|nr:type I-C CRISPR-associated protein Cas8c/Csd1 [Deltaproteobacteria bacterium]